MTLGPQAPNIALTESNVLGNKAVAVASLLAAIVSSLNMAACSSDAFLTACRHTCSCQKSLSDAQHTADARAAVCNQNEVVHPSVMQSNSDVPFCRST